MTIYGLLTFCAVYALAVAAPGPGVAAVIARGLAHGLKGTPAFIAGFMVGDLVWFAIAATGLAALAKTAAMAFVVIKWIGVAYLLYLAWKLWSAPAKRVEVAETGRGEHGWRAFLASLLLTLANPKTILFFVALLPTVIDLASMNLTRFVEISAAMCVVLPAVLGAYAFLAARARELFTTPKSVRRLNRGSGVAMAGAAIAVATR
jgi:threonine/homoserine/homoserine lactone efflux protein